MRISPLISPDTAAQAEQLYTRFKSLEKHQQIVLIILAVIYKPIGITKLAEVVRELKLIGFLNKKAGFYSLSTEEKSRFEKMGLLHNTREGMTINRILANVLMHHLDDLEQCDEAIGQDKLKSIIYAAEQVVPVVTSFYWQDQKTDKQRVFRDLYFLQEFNKLEGVLEFNKNPQIIDLSDNHILVELFFLPFSLEDILKLPELLQYQAFSTLFHLCYVQGQSIAYALTCLEQFIQARPDHKLCRLLLAEQYLYSGRLTDFEDLHDVENKSSYALQLSGAYHFITGHIKTAIEYFELAIAAKNKITRRKKQYIGGILGGFYKLSLAIHASQVDAAYFDNLHLQCEYEYSDQKTFSYTLSLNAELRRIVRRLQDGDAFVPQTASYNMDERIDSLLSWLDKFNQIVGVAWCTNKNEISSEHAYLEQAQACTRHFKAIGMGLFANFSQQVVQYLQSEVMQNDEQLVQTKEDIILLPDCISTRPKWEHALDRLVALGPQSNSSQSGDNAYKAEEKRVRMIWELLIGRFNDELIPREQKRTKTGWSKGRVVSLKRLYEETDTFTYLSESDQKICRAISAYQGYGYYGKTEYELAGLPALRAAVDAPNIFLAEDLNQPIDLSEKSPELLVSQQGQQLCLSMADTEQLYEQYEDFLHAPSDFDNAINSISYVVKQVSEGKYQLVIFSKEHLKVLKILGENGLLVPISAKAKVLEGIAAIAPFLNIQSDIAELDTGLETVDCDPNLVINIQPIQQGLEFHCVVLPFGELGPSYKPGIGNASLSAEINNQRVATNRNLANEQDLLDQLDTLCPAFLSMPDTSLILEDTQQALEALEQLEVAVKAESMPLTLRWPKGKKIKLSQPLSGEQIQLGVSKKNEWFDISGELQINNEEVIELRKLLSLVASSNGRFVKLDAEHVLSLSHDLRQKLEHLQQVTDDGKFHPLASLQVQEATSGMRMKTIHAWDKQTKRMHEANAISPLIPSTLQAELRDYQHEGFDWAMRLAHWGAGACLADDMGLGKTMQALGILVARAQGGPSLVIAPTSVCFNWQQEAQKFAPTLNIKVFSEATTSSQRATLLQELAAFDCVILSYGLLQRESELLAKVKWHTMIADEAQALKNPLAKRTKAAYALNADFKMITTGTPIENDLTELWSLFRLINPGLLGNLKQFTKRYIQAIENAKEDKLAARKARQGLKTLIQPFILRRLKSQVLTELPARTNINISVSLSEQEQAFYEALRLNAIDNISQATNTANAGEQRIKMLAELTKLRQACCHPKLVLEESQLPSAKLAALDELLDELTVNKHKALIFSQFVGHLQIIKQHIEAKGFSYQYLDGSTPQKERQRRVNDFQSGDGEVFLISLKAGGFGLNLTAADYVIHMDPWWNPAVEDQASDRAHRMGQTRPVTIYRLIAKNTIEEKIVSLHQHKRDLADKLLSGNEHATKLSVEDMLILLKDTF
ncbi:DEAD/DEAH box helicase [Agaribacter flavus]|uniref:DEAD/DEAH box helicase n=1 Tax=Agaribacter flavus TaxID=1902781 RepID=A0ABV7FKF0_9ALTE